MDKFTEVLLNKVGFGYLLLNTSITQKLLGKKKVFVNRLLSLVGAPGQSLPQNVERNQPPPEPVQASHSILTFPSGAQHCYMGGYCFLASGFLLRVCMCVINFAIDSLQLPSSGTWDHCQISTAGCAGISAIGASLPKAFCTPRADEHSGLWVCALLSEWEEIALDVCSMELQCPVGHYLWGMWPSPWLGKKRQREREFPHPLCFKVLTQNPMCSRSQQ